MKKCDLFRKAIIWYFYKVCSKSTVACKSCMYSKSTRHNDFLKIISKTPVDQTEGKEPKKREDYYRRTLKAYSPFGLNVEDSVLPAPFNLKMGILVFTA